mmetsp:Transcript_3460/g.4998  ORF Transcript_3460/g.4998 Transcript_3460/m.4998 type:complete len:282 (-) Transcript_3460:238-1083(-)|eukprot:CAMPEP_0203752484 /NCGR_PEP_ID=MMETSP0098-20131031/6406_1 /ASSEMBLY_ACC=CAM_ASM_000208 /TAXON_ID=96639 /ORGANISM=" , Strain NY0313808BC1" /LENGTH=281 /DNA_ID=CAMNT_0050642677 /DNA_START=124 /DNA_END=969 /DNA_ORIENTATION=+
MRVFALSDIHTDFDENLKWVESLDKRKYLNDVVIVAGDVSEKICLLRTTLEGFTGKFKAVFFCAGNHDLWIEGNQNSSLEKWDQIKAMCKELGVHTAPTRIGGVLLVPLYSWYSGKVPSGYSGYNEFNLKVLQGWQDFKRCAWPYSIIPKREEGSIDVKTNLHDATLISDYFIEENEQIIETVNAMKAICNAQVITFSHFLPRYDLNPEGLKFQELRLVCCSPRLDEQLRAVGSCVHIFGHTHIPTNKKFDGVTYRQLPLGYPGEEWIRDRNMDNFVVWPA